MFFGIDHFMAIIPAKDLERKLLNNFVITGLLSIKNSEYHEHLLDSILSSKIDDIPDVLADYRPQYVETTRKYDRRQVDLDYISFFNKFQSWYCEETSN